MYGMRQQPTSTRRQRQQLAIISASTIILAVYAFAAFATLADAGVVKRDVAVAASTIAGNGTTETPATTAALRQHETDRSSRISDRNDDKYDDIKHAASDELSHNGMMSNDELMIAHDGSEADYGILDNEK